MFICLEEIKVIKIVNRRNIAEEKYEKSAENNKSFGGREITESIIGEVVEGVSIGGIGEFGVGSREPEKAVQSYLREVSIEVGVLRQNHRASRHEAVYQRLLPRHQINQGNKLTTQRRKREREKGVEYWWIAEQGI